MGTKAMDDEMEVVLKRFGDEQSTLLDRFERLSFEAQLNKAILGRSLSEPHAPRYQLPPPLLVAPLESKVTQGSQHHHHHHRGFGFQKIFKKLFKPIFGIRKDQRKDSMPEHKDFKFMKAFSKSLRV